MIGSLCIWCAGPTEKTDVSHVVPECFGNDDQQTLPSGTVCRACNNYFGCKIEPALSEDPIIHALCVASRLIDPGDGNAFRDKMFHGVHTPIEPVRRDLKLDAKIDGNRINVGISYAISGTLSFEYSRRREARFSRALHKLAFESYVWQHLEGGLPTDAPDAHSPVFNDIKQWARFGQPHGYVRPYIRMPATVFANSWEFRTIRYPDHLGFDMRLYGDCFAVSLTSATRAADVHLRSWCFEPENNAVLVGTGYELLRERT
jgi:hypothetical protein